MTALVTCPNGHQVKPIPVIYGLPTPGLMADAEAGRVRLGGCDPTFEDEQVGDCPACGSPILRSARRSVPSGEGNEPHFRLVGEQPTDGRH